MANNFCYVKVNEAKVYKTLVNNKPKTKINSLLMGTYIDVIKKSGEWLNIKSINDQTGWIKASDTCNEAGLKCFFADVGQGDGILIEIGDKKIIIDGGKNGSLKTFMNDWKYKYARDKNTTTHIDYLFITHLDDDHFSGLLDVIYDQNYTFENICFAGITKFKDHNYKTTLGDLIESGNKKYLEKIYDKLEDIPFDDTLNGSIMDFITAIKAKQSTCDITSKRLEANCVVMDEVIGGTQFKLEIAGPYTEKVNGKPRFLYFGDDAQTINGHCLVIKITFGTFSMLLGGDLNEKAQKYLTGKHASETEDANSFKADVYKVGHHGSNDFSVDFLKWVSPKASIFSSGDNDTYGHPSSIAIGCAGKYSRSNKPLVFSTELARSYDKGTILYGTIFLRSNGTQTYLAQMKEGGSQSDPWEAYEVE
jgi:beta-lactamase superfamily II metal-dependent hydrolase